MAEAPRDRKQYEARTAYNSRVTGYGAEVTTHMPCPWCAAPDFNALRIISVEEDMAQERTCSACGRSGKALVTRDGGGVSAEFVQTGGPDAPEWLDPAPRRVDG